MAQGSTLTRLGAGTATAAAVFVRKPDDSVNLGDSTNPIRVDPTGSTTQPISAASLPLPSGAATSAKQDTEIASLASLDGKTVAVNTGAVVLAAGSAAYGKLSPNSGVDIGDVDVTSIIPGTGATNLGKAVDSASGSTDTGVAALFIRDDALSAITPAEGDYAPSRVDANGAQWVIHSGNVTVNAHAVTNAGTFVVQENGAALTSLQLIDDTVHATNGAISKSIAIGGMLDDAATTAATEDNVAPVRITAQRAVHINVRNVAGTEMGTASNPFQVTLANTGANATAVTTSDSASQVDDAAFTPATGRVVMMGAEADDTSTDSVDEGDGGALRMSLNRNLNVRIRDNAGNERGLNIGAAGELLAAQSGTWTEANSAAIAASLSVMDDWDNTASDGASVTGDVAHDGVDAGEPVKIGGKAITAEITPVAANDRVNAVYDITGKQVVMPYALKENFVSGTTAAMTGTTSTSLLAAPAGSLRNYITQITVANSHATVNTFVTIQDGNGGTALYTLPAACLCGGAVINFPVPLKQPTTATALYVACVTTGSNTIASASGYTGT